MFQSALKEEEKTFPPRLIRAPPPPALLFGSLQIRAVG